MPQRIKREPAAGRGLQRDLRRAEEHHLGLARQQAAPVSVAQQDGVGRQRVIRPGAGKARAHHQRRLDMAQRLVEIRRLLLGHPVQPRLGDPRHRLGREGIHVPDHRLGQQIPRQRVQRAAVRADHRTAKRQHLVE